MRHRTRRRARGTTTTTATTPRRVVDHEQFASNSDPAPNRATGISNREGESVSLESNREKDNSNSNSNSNISDAAEESGDNSNTNISPHQSTSGLVAVGEQNRSAIIIQRPRELCQRKYSTPIKSEQFLDHDTSNMTVGSREEINATADDKKVHINIEAAAQFQDVDVLVYASHHQPEKQQAQGEKTPEITQDKLKSIIKQTLRPNELLLVLVEPQELQASASIKRVVEEVAQLQLAAERQHKSGYSSLLFTRLGPGQMAAQMESLVNLVASHSLDPQSVNLEPGDARRIPAAELLGLRLKRAAKTTTTNAIKRLKDSVAAKRHRRRRVAKQETSIVSDTNQSSGETILHNLEVDVNVVAPVTPPPSHLDDQDQGQDHDHQATTTQLPDECDNQSGAHGERDDDCDPFDGQEEPQQRLGNNSFCEEEIRPTVKFEKITEAQLDSLSSLIKIIRGGDFKEFNEMLEKRSEFKRNLLNVPVDGQTALHYAIIYGRSLAWCKQLVARGANPNLTNRAGWHPIHLAAFNGSRDMLRYLIDCMEHQ